MEAVKNDGLALVDASEELINNPEIVMEAVKNNGRVLNYASEELRNNPEIVMEAVKNDGSALEYASEELRNNPEFVKKVERAIKEEELKKLQQKDEDLTEIISKVKQLEQIQENGNKTVDEQ